MKLLSAALLATILSITSPTQAAVGNWWDRTHTEAQELCIDVVNSPKGLDVPREYLSIHPESNDEFSHIVIVMPHLDGSRDQLVATCRNGDIGKAIIGGTFGTGQKVSRVKVGWNW